MRQKETKVVNVMKFLPEIPRAITLQLSGVKLIDCEHYSFFEEVKKHWKWQEIKNGFKTRLSRKYSEKFFVTLDSVPRVTISQFIHFNSTYWSRFATNCIFINYGNDSVKGSVRRIRIFFRFLLLGESKDQSITELIFLNDWDPCRTIRATSPRTWVLNYEALNVFVIIYVLHNMDLEKYILHESIIQLQLLMQCK